MHDSLNNQDWRREQPLLWIVLIISLIFLCRLEALPAVGEEGRWARGAVQMLETGDWIVPRQQGQIFPERPPLNSWAMAVVGAIRGEVDLAAIRLPSAAAIVATAVLIYAYARAFLSQLGALAAAIAYATGGQVLQIGRHGESEALFTLFVSASLLLWHYGYARQWSRVRMWSTGYACMAVAALTKGPQAPAYFLAVTCVYAILVRRDWRAVVCWGHLAGAAVAAAIVGAWQIPFYVMTDWESVSATWTGLAGDRFQLDGMLEHVALYPLETFACLLPWSPLLIALVYPPFRRRLGSVHGMLPFVVTALVVTYPTVWFASAARGRYFMPLYPCIALLIGSVVEACVAEQAGSWGRLNWRNFLIGTAVAAVSGGFAVLAISLTTDNQQVAAALPPPLAVGFLIASVIAAGVLIWCRRNVNSWTAQTAVLTLALLLGLVYDGIVISVAAASWNNPAATIAKLKAELPDPSRLISFDAVDHRFCYVYRDFIAEKPWPVTADEVPGDFEYFCFNWTPGDNETTRLTGRGRSWRKATARLPFEWEEVTRICVERKIRDRPQREVVIARIKRGPDASLARKPQDKVSQ